jgi:hypothetical protein
MGSSQTTTGQNSSGLNFNPTSMGVFSNFLQNAGGGLQGQLNNPFNNPAYNQGLQQQTQASKMAGQNLLKTLQQNAKTSGTFNKSFMQTQMPLAQRAAQAYMGQGNLGMVQGALARQGQSIGSGLNYSPLMTGESGTSRSTSSMGGLGTWLPTVMGAGLGAGFNAMQNSPSGSSFPSASGMADATTAAGQGGGFGLGQSMSQFGLPFGMPGMPQLNYGQ